jgi:hypothetical protein
MIAAENTEEDGPITEGSLGRFREKGHLALLLLHHRPLRVCSVVAPSHPTFLAKMADLGIFRQALRVCGEPLR